MGFWGTALFSNDTTCDVRDGYLDLLSEQHSSEDAYERTIEQCREIIDSDEEPLFWLALAETQWRVGRLREDVKAKALGWIEKDGGLELWEDENPKGGDGWRNTLQKLKGKLESPMPKEKRFPKIDRNPWNLNDVYAYRFHDEKRSGSAYVGKYMLLQKVGEDRYYEKNRLYMQIQVINHVFDELPELDDISKFRILPLDKLFYIKSRKPKGLTMRGILSVIKPSDYPKKHLTYIGNKSGPVTKVINGRIEALLNLENFSFYYHFWQGRKYEEIEEGIYDYIPE